MSLTGRRPTGRAKTFGRALLDGLDALGTAMNDGPKLTRIKEIDAEIYELRQERDHLIAGLTQPYEGYELSDSYDPNWRKSSDHEAIKVSFATGEGRLTKCKGRAYIRDYDVHPGCPYADRNHGPHEFTLRD